MLLKVVAEDCLTNDKIDNRFQLVLVAAKRARLLTTGAEALIPEENDKSTVIALREIAEQKIGKDILDQATFRSGYIE